MSTATKELAFLILQFLEEKGFKETAHKLECESGLYFDMKYFEDMVLAGKFDDAESYLCGFTTFDDNRHSTKIYFELRKQKFLEALDNNDRANALDILMEDLKDFYPGYEELFKELTQLLTIDNIRENESLSAYGDVDSLRKLVMDELKLIIRANPMFSGKLNFPAIKSQRLHHLLNQSLNWQHLFCKDAVANPVIQTLFEDHVCKPCLDLLSMQSEESTSFEKSDTSLSTSSSANPSHITDPETAVVNPTVIGSPSEASNEVTSAFANDLPTNVVQTLKEDSTTTSMDFHPSVHTLLLVGTDVGTIGLWDVDSSKKLFSRNFRVGEVGVWCTNSKDQVALVKPLIVSVKRIMWSPDGSLFGVAFSEHIVQLYSYHGGNSVNQYLEIDAHDGGVNDLAFSSCNQQLLVLTCGEDMKIKAWDALSGVQCYTFEGHKAPVCSICPHMKQEIPFICSTSIDGKIKAWLYDGKGDRVDFDGPCYGHSSLAYSADGQRLFSCGSGKDGEPYLVEWDDTEGFIKRTYKGLKKPCFSAVHFDSTQDQLLAAGDDHMIKFWDMDNVELWTVTDANGELPENPCIRFNKAATLLAVTAKENKIKILANNYGISRKLSEVHNSVNLETLGKNVGKKGSEVARSNSTEESHNQPKIWSVFEICEPSQCQFLQLPVHSKLDKLERLTYNHVGKGILALASNGNQVLWKWPKTSLNLDGMATTQVSPHFWQPKDSLQCMTNDLMSTNAQDRVSFFALSKNDSYLMSTSGGTVSLFNLLTYKALTTFMTPPPMATCLAFYPRDNNVIAVGMADSNILIYNVRTERVLRRLRGHPKRVTAVAFASNFNVLVSGDVDAQIIVWNTNRWEKQKDGYLQMHGQEVPRVLSETQIQFNKDQTHFLAVYHTHLAIYETIELRCVKQLNPEGSVVITQAAYSSDGQIVYAILADGTLAIFDALSARMHCRIRPSAYLVPTPSYGTYPAAIAANPQKPTQFALGLTDGSVYVIEPQQRDGDWSWFALDDKEEPVNSMAAGSSKVSDERKFINFI